MQIQGTPVTARVEQAIKAASEQTGTSFDYLVSTAYRESTFRPELKATTSTATGLFQFLEQTWLGQIKDDGASVGLAAEAAAISRDAAGRYDVADPAARQRILDLRNDPLVSSVMAAKFTERNHTALARSLGGEPSQKDLYVAHVLGPTGGARLIRMVRETPNAEAAQAFPREAAANVPIFYAKDGSPRTAADVYGFLTRNHAPTPLAAASGAAPTAQRYTPAALADLVRAQAAARVGSEAYGGSPGTGAADRRATRVAIGQTSMPGEAGGATAPSGGRLEGWRARVPADAFAASTRTDGASLQAPRLKATGLLGYGDTAAAGAAATGGAAAIASALAPSAALRLSSAAMAALPASVTGTAGAALRPSRLVASDYAGGAPAAPLPMVATGTGAVRPSRFSMASLLAQDPVPGRGAIAPASTRAVATNAASTTTGLTPLSILPPGPGEAAAVMPPAAGFAAERAPVAAPRQAATEPPVRAGAGVAGPTRAASPSAAHAPLDLTRLMRLAR